MPIIRRQFLSSLGLIVLQSWIASAVSAPAVPADWITVAAGHVLTLQAPPGTRFETRPGADSFLGVFLGAGFEIQLDYGVYSDPLAERSQFSSYKSEPTRVNGKPATLVHATPNKGSSTYRGTFVGLHVTELGRTVVGELSLTLIGLVSDEAQEALIRRIFATIRLKPVS
jgi:hypothetical protein